MNTENLKTLKIHKLSQEQYERELLAGNVDPNALYLTPDDGDAGSLSKSGGSMSGDIDMSNYSITNVGKLIASTSMIFDSADDLPATGTPGQIYFVKRGTQG